MNTKELGELRRRLRPNKNAISHVYGCYVGATKEIIGEVDQSLALLSEDDAEGCLSLLKKALSGSLGRNLIDVGFTTQQVAEGEEHKLLRDLRDSKLKDRDLRRAFYEKVIQSVDMGDDSYLILLAHDTYDVPFKSKNDELLGDSSDTVFSYIVCAVCPMREGKPGLGYLPADNVLHMKTAGQLAAPPELGFLFPTFDDRAANIYNALAYARKPDELHQEFLDAIFHTEPPMSPGEQREAFQTALREGLEGACGLEVVQAVHERLTAKIEEHREAKDPEPLTVTAGDVAAILRDFGAEEPQITTFCEKCGELFGEDAVLSPANLIDSRRFEVWSAGITVSVPPEQSYQVETRLIDGKRYLLIPAGEGLEVNGMPVDWVQTENE